MAVTATSFLGHNKTMSLNTLPPSLNFHVMNCFALSADYCTLYKTLLLKVVQLLLFVSCAGLSKCLLVALSFIISTIFQ
jgi:hypothetical protein